MINWNCFTDGAGKYRLCNLTFLGRSFLLCIHAYQTDRFLFRKLYTFLILIESVSLPLHNSAFLGLSTLLHLHHFADVLSSTYHYDTPRLPNYLHATTQFIPVSGWTFQSIRLPRGTKTILLESKEHCQYTLSALTVS